MSAPAKTTRHLIAENSTPLAAEKPCGCCGEYALYRIDLADGTSYLLCAYCDTEKR